MTGPALRQALSGYIDKMPPLPTSVGKVLEICQRPSAPPSELNRVISLDPVLLARVMKLINSAYYGLNQEVTSLIRAIIMLGLNTVKNLALSSAVLGTLNAGHRKESVLNLDGFWLHSLCVGVTAKLLARKRGVPAQDQDTYFFCGLLHDIGKIPLNNRAPDEYLLALQTSGQARISLLQAEQQVLDLDHTEVGQLILDAWQLSEDLRDAVVWHHRPQDYNGPHHSIVGTVAIADYFANIFEIGFSGNRFPTPPAVSVYQDLNLTWGEVENLEAEVRTEIDKARDFLKIG